MKVKYIVTMMEDFFFQEVEVENCENREELNKKIEEGKVIRVKEDETIYEINSNYIIYWR